MTYDARMAFPDLKPFPTVAQLNWRGCAISVDLFLFIYIYMVVLHMYIFNNRPVVYMQLSSAQPESQISSLR